MNIEELINALDEIILAGWSLPLTNGQCIVDREKVKDIIQEMRLNIPTEIRHAKAIVADKNDILAKAKKEADEIVAKAKKEAQRIASEEEILKLANSKASEVVGAAQAKSKEIKQNTSAYSESVLEKMEDVLAKTLIEVKQTRQQIKNITK
jgi:cell division septum initiation protein DivIVA